MKKNLLLAIFTLFLSIGFCIHGIAEGNTQKAIQKTPLVHKKLSDLTVKIAVKAEKHGTKYYAVVPRYIVTNRGTAVARNFKVVLYQLYRSSSKARVRSTRWTTNTVASLGINRSWIFDYNPINNAVWDSEKGGQVGFRIVADHDKQVWESKEDNNTAWKWWPMRLRVLKKK